MLDSKFLELLCCPITKTKMRTASDSEIANLNELINEGKIKNRIGSTIEEPVYAGLINEESTILMKIEDEIVNAIADELIFLPK